MELWIKEKNGHRRKAKEIECIECHQKWLIRKDRNHKGLCRNCWQISRNEKFVVYKNLRYRARESHCEECGKKYLIIKSARERKKCKECHMKFVHKKKEGTVPYNKGKHNPLAKSYDKKYKSQKAAEKLVARRKKAIELKGNECSRCKEKNFPIYAYEFHHRNPDEKEKKMMSGSDDKFFKELEKCDLLCANCHRIIHFGDERLE